jgi:5-methylcytosine-specific restriction enzyme subunit McrC
VRRPVELEEYGRTEADLPERTARALAQVAPHALRVAPAKAAGRWRLTADKYVGSIAADGVRVLIRTKINAPNVFLFLGAELPEKAWQDGSFDYGEGGDLLPAVLAFFARMVESTLAKGVLRSYRPRTALLPTARGRIDVAAQIRRGALDLPVACRCDEHTADNSENRYAKAAIRLALGASGLPAGVRNCLTKALIALDEVADVPQRPEAIDALTITRLTRYYQPMLRLAELVLRNRSLVDRAGARTASAFLLDMPKLFERFVADRFGVALTGRVTVVEKLPLHLDTGNRIPLWPDVVLQRRGRTVGVADIKYKLSKDAKARGDDYRQLLAYAVTLGLDHGTLIYCRSAGSPAVDSSRTVVRLGTTLRVHAIDASAPPAQVLAEVDRLAGTLAGYSGA